MVYFRGRYYHDNGFNVNSINTENLTRSKREVLVTKANVTPGAAICHITNPLLVALDTAELKKRCYRCYAAQDDPLGFPSQRHSEDKFDKLRPCEGCEVVYFCSSSCKAMADRECRHGQECQVYQQLTPNIPPSNLRAVLRLLFTPRGVVGPIAPQLWKSLIQCNGHVDQFREAGGKRWEDLINLTQCAIEYSGTSESYETVLNIFCSLLMYSVPLQTSQLERIGLAMHPFMASIPHSCNPNSVVTFNYTQYGSDHHMMISPLRAIGPNKKITIAYVDTKAPLFIRENELKSNFFIDCTCKTCVDEDEMSEFEPEPVEGIILGRVSELVNDSLTDTTRDVPLQRLRYSLYLLLSNSWALNQYPMSLILRSLIKVYVNDQQYNLAFAFALLLKRTNKSRMKRRSGCLHPRKLADKFVLIRLMDKIIEGEGWAFQKLSLADRGLNLVGYAPTGL